MEVLGLAVIWLLTCLRIVGYNIVPAYWGIGGNPTRGERCSLGECEQFKQYSLPRNHIYLQFCFALQLVFLSLRHLLRLALRYKQWYWPDRIISHNLVLVFHCKPLVPFFLSLSQVLFPWQAFRLQSFWLQSLSLLRSLLVVLRLSQGVLVPVQLLPFIARLLLPVRVFCYFH